MGWHETSSIGSRKARDQLKSLMARRRDAAAIAANARREIERAFGLLKIFERPRGDAVLHFVAALDVEAVGAVASPHKDAPTSNMAHRRVVEASAFGIPAIYNRCAPSRGSVTGIDRQIYAEARELFDFCYAYEQIDFSFKLADKGQMQIFVPNRQPRITFAYADKSADIADTALRGRELEVVFTGERLDPDLNAQRHIFGTLTEMMRSRVIRQNDRCDYTCGPDEIQLMRTLGSELVKSFPAEMDAAASVDGITFAQLRLFWGALLALSNTHFMAHHLASGGGVSGWPFETMVYRKHRRAFVEIIAKITQMREDVVNVIIGWYIYDPRTSNRCAILQPFLPLSDDTLCLPVLFVHGNNMERNFFKLMNRHTALRPFARAVEDRKETVALGYLASIFQSPTYRTRDRVKIPGITDADLLIYEVESGFLLVLQHKWVAAPETVEESWDNDARLSEGVTQAVKARDALRDQPELARRALRLSDDERIERIEAVTVCRGFERTGFAYPPAVPVITEVSFVALYNRSRGFESFWKGLNSRPDLQRAEQQVEDCKMRLTLAGFDFVMPGLMY
jgi:hypothetical protein